MSFRSRKFFAIAIMMLAPAFAAGEASVASGEAPIAEASPQSVQQPVQNAASQASVPASQNVEQSSSAPTTSVPERLFQSNLKLADTMSELNTIVLKTILDANKSGVSECQSKLDAFLGSLGKGGYILAKAPSGQFYLTTTQSFEKAKAFDMANFAKENESAIKANEEQNPNLKK